MKANRNQKINRICHKLYSKYRKNVISLVTAAVLLVTSMPLADISGVVSKMVSTVTNVITAMAADTYTDISNDIKNGVYTIQNADDFKKLLNADPAVYQKITVLFSNNQSQFKASDFTVKNETTNVVYPKDLAMKNILSWEQSKQMRVQLLIFLLILLCLNILVTVQI